MLMGFKHAVFILCFLDNCTIVFNSIYSIPMPRTLSHCLKKRALHLRPSDVPGHSISSYCLKTFKLRENNGNNLKLDVPEETLNWISSLIRQLKVQRHKRQTLPIRVRKEIRMMSEKERFNFLQAVRDLKADTSVYPNKYDALARIHSGDYVVNSAHDSSNFLSWHRVYLYLYEQALREKYPHVTIPYWDHTMDFDMDDPTKSVIWTSKFLGNGDGMVTSGPFANWITGDNVPLIRNIGSTGTLMSKTNVMDVLSRNYHVQINEGTADIRFSLEGHHDGVHRWIDGQMAGLHTSPQDPVFYMHHCFIDYIWYQFRLKQKLNGINPETDYPPTNLTLHEPYRQMAAFSPLRNIDGFSNFWDSLVLYEQTPSMCSGSVSCESPYLACIRDQCVSKSGTSVGELTRFQNSINGSANGISPSKMKALALGPLPIGKRFPYYFVDIRTRGDPMTVRKRPKVEHSTRQFPFSKKLYLELKHWKFLRDKQRNILHLLKSKQNMSGKHNLDNNFKNQMMSNQNEKSHSQGTNEKFILDSTVQQPKRFSDMQTFQNTFLLDGRADMSQWIFIPVRILYRKPKHSNVNFFNIRQQFNINSDRPMPYAMCHDKQLDVQKIVVHSHGINYNGAFTNYVMVGGTQNISCSETYVAVKNPYSGVSKAVITAYDSCGRMCSSSCLEYGSHPVVFKPCSGTIKIAGTNPKMFEPFGNPPRKSNRQFKEQNIPFHMKNKIFLSFNCFYENSWPWENCI